MLIAVSTEQNSDVRSALGNAHYSYTFAARRFIDALSFDGYRVEVVSQPEIFKARQTYRVLLSAEPEEVTHLIFRSTENIRLMVGAKNIVVFFWEFPFLRDHHLITEAITSDQLHMLKLADELWVSCAYTYNVFRRYGLNNVRVVPPPLYRRHLPERVDRTAAHQSLQDVPAVPLLLYSSYGRDVNSYLCTEAMKSLGSITPVKAGTGRIFLSICNPGDRRKNLLNLIDGFRLATNGSDHDTLILKLIVPNVLNFRSESLYDTVAPLQFYPTTLYEPRILVVFDYLDEMQMNALFSLSDFYLCASHCEGFNLPLLEAMAFGTVPITTRNTAMVDYIDESNAVVISERFFPCPVEQMAGDVAGTIYDMSIASRFDIAEAVSKAAGLSSNALRSKEDASRTTVESLYGEKAVVALMTERFNVINQVV